MIDFNCFIGTWAFYPTYVETIDQLKALHAKNGITKGYVSSLKSVTYRDFFFSEEELHEAIKDTDYRHVMTVDPRFPACLDIVKYGIENWDIAAVRIIPGFQGYKLTDTRLEDLCKLLKEHDLPLYITLHMQDDRNCYLVQNVPPSKGELCDFIDSHRDMKLLLCNAGSGDLDNAMESILAHPACFFDMSGQRNRMGNVEYLSRPMQERLVFGTMAPILSTKAACLHLEVEDIAPEIKENLKTGRHFL